MADISSGKTPTVLYNKLCLWKMLNPARNVMMKYESVFKQYSSYPILKEEQGEGNWRNDSTKTKPNIPSNCHLSSWYVALQIQICDPNLQCTGKHGYLQWHGWFFPFWSFARRLGSTLTWPTRFQCTVESKSSKNQGSNALIQIQCMNDMRVEFGLWYSICW